MATHLPKRKPPERGESDGDGRIEVGAGDVPDGVDHDHDDESPRHAYPRERHLPIDLVHGDGAAAGEDDKVGADHLRYQLFYMHDRIS